ITYLCVMPVQSLLTRYEEVLPFRILQARSHLLNEPATNQRQQSGPCSTGCTSDACGDFIGCQACAGTQMTSGPQELELIAREALLRGLERESIRKAMSDAGWTADQARAAIGAYCDLPFPVRVPIPGSL